MNRIVLVPLAVLTLICGSISSGLTAVEFHVAPNGDDAQAGTAAEPFATLVRARDAIRQLKQAGPLREPVVVSIHEGTYCLDQSLVLSEPDSGAPDARIVWQSAGGGPARVCGGVVLASDAFRPLDDPQVSARLDPAARGHVVQAELSGRVAGANNTYPDAFRGAPATCELFFDDQRMTPARWPNEGWATIAEIVDSGAQPRDGDASGRGGVFAYGDSQPARWDVAAGVWLQGYWCFDWYEETIKVQSIDTTKRLITLARPALYGVRQGNPAPRRYRALNVLEELDQPGEFYLDPSTGRLYFWPPGPIDNARVVVSTLNAPLISIRDAAHVTLRGLVVETSLGVGIEVTDGRDNRIEGCEVRNTRLLGIRVQGGIGHGVDACRVHDTGTGGIWLGGGDRRTLTPAGHTATNNRIWRFSIHQLCYASGLTLGGVGQRAAHNLLYEAPHMAVSISGNDHVFEYNIVHDVCTASDDAAALYKGRNPSCRGNIIRYNFWRDIGSPLGHGTAAVYFDDGDGGDTVFGNVFLRCGHPGRGSFGTIFSHGGHDNLAENNIFIDCQRALGSAPWNDQRWKETLAGGHGCNWQKLLLQDVDITKPPYTTRYPALIGFMDPPPGSERVNRAKNNVLVRCGQAHSGNWTYAADEIWETAEDPGFVDAAQENFTLRPDAEVFRRLPGFQPIPFASFGPQPDGVAGASDRP